MAVGVRSRDGGGHLPDAVPLQGRLMRGLAVVERDQPGGGTPLATQRMHAITGVYRDQADAARGAACPFALCIATGGRSDHLSKRA